MNKKVKHYEDFGKDTQNQQSWDKVYSEYLKNAKLPDNKKNSSGYIDIDSVYTCRVKVPEYYKDLTDFLNKQNKTIFKEEAKFFWKPDEKSKKRPEKLTIHTLDNVKNNLGEMYLTSDTFAFSEPKPLTLEEWKGTHPLGAYLNLNQQSDSDYSEAVKKVAQYIYDTRTIGGAFIWPKVEVRRSNGVQWKSIYNQNRGVMVKNLGSYINDRVDLTLQEIKMFYYYLKKNPEDDNKTIRSMNENGYVLLKGDDSNAICQWLKYFGSFEQYVDFFCFKGNFVDDEYNPVNVITRDSLRMNPENSKVNTELYKGQFREMLANPKGLGEMLEFIQEQVLKRSETIVSLPIS